MTFDFTDQEINIIGAALAEIPYKIAAPVLAKMQEVINKGVENDQPKDS